MGGSADVPLGTATSVGPVPFTDPVAAVDFALAASPEFPTVPVPADLDRSLLAQAVSGLASVRLAPPGLLVVDGRPQVPGPEVGADLSGPAFEVLHAFVDRLRCIPDGGHDGPVRVGLAGPVTTALALVTAGVEMSRAAAIAGALVPARAVALLQLLRPVAGPAPVAVVMSEPGLIGAMHPTFPLSPWETRNLLDPVVDALDTAAGDGELLIGVHIPGRTDWETVLASGVSLISAPADGGLAGWAEPLAAMLEGGGRVAWGAVPVDQPLGTSEELLWRRLTAEWCDLANLGVDPMLVRMRSMVGPADGLGHFGPSQAERVVDLSRSLATRVRHQTVGARIPLGA